MAKTITGISVDVYGENAVTKKTIDDTVESLQAAVGGRCFDIARRKIGGKYFDIVCDDEGLFHENPIPSAMSEGGQVMLVGNLFICRHKGPELASLTDSDCDLIMDAVRYVFTPMSISPVVTCEY